jgi:RNA polymerase sigma factor (sigma-70 family)
MIFVAILTEPLFTCRKLMMTDLELLTLFARDRSEDSLRALLQRHAGLVHAAALRQIHDPGLAEDITQAVFIAMAHKAVSLNAKKIPLPAWLLAATRFAARDVLRRRAARTHHEQRAAVMSTQSSPNVDADALARILDDTLNRLSLHDRTAVALYYLENRSLREVGEALCISERAAQKRVSRALIRLRGILMRQGIVCPADALETNLHRCCSAAVSPILITAAVNSVLHSAPAASASSVIAQHILRSLRMKTLKAFALTTAVIATFAAPAVPLTYYALSGGPHPIPSAVADATSQTTTDAPAIRAQAVVNYAVLIDKKFQYPRTNSDDDQKISSEKTADGHTHALLIAYGNPIDLNPNGFTDSWVQSIDGTRQIGYGKTTSGVLHALLWSSSPEGVIDLNPSGFTSSQAWGISGDQQVGSGTTAQGANHAMLWNNTAANFIDLNPPGFAQSWAIATNGTQQVGLGMTSVNPMPHALLWNGAAKSFVDLQQFLPEGYTMSKAYTITDTGEIIGIADDSSYRQHNVEWIPQGSTSMGNRAVGN